MKKYKIVGINYLHEHNETQKKLNLDSEHVIVDKNEWKEICDYFNQFPEQVKHIGSKQTTIS